MISPLSLEPLLLALREAGLPVGVAEVDRLRQVFALQPDLAGDEPDQTRRRLQVWLRALLVKSPQDRATFERIYDRWLARAEQDLQFRTRPESPPPLLPSPPSLPPPRSPVVERDWRGWYIAAAVLVLVTIILVIAWLYQPKPSAPLLPPKPPPAEELPPQPPPKTPTEIRQRSFFQLNRYLDGRAFQSDINRLASSRSQLAGFSGCRGIVAVPEPAFMVAATHIGADPQGNDYA